MTVIPERAKFGYNKTGLFLTLGLSAFVRFLFCKPRNFFSFAQNVRRLAVAAG